MNQKQPQPVPTPHAEISLGDIYYVLFKRKWLILIFAVCGFIAAGVVLSTQHLTYESSAKLLVTHIDDTKSPVETLNNGALDVKPLDQTTSILASEVQILKNFDSAKATADALQPSKILAPYGGGTNEDAAAHLIMNNLEVQSAPSSQIIFLTFSHRDPSIVQLVLQQMITNYMDKEHDIHQKPGEFDNFLTEKRDSLTSELAQIASAIAAAKNAAGVVDLSAAMADYETQEGAAVRQMYQTKNDLAEAMATADQLKKSIPAPVQINTSSGTNAPAQPSAKTIASYRRLIEHLANLQAQQDRLEETYTDEHPLVKTNELEIQAAEDKKDKMEEENPGLLAVDPGKPSGANPLLDLEAAYNAAVNRIEVLKVSMSEQAAELQTIRNRGTNLVQLESTIGENERKRGEDQAELQKIEASLQASTIETELSGRNSDVEPIENPTPPVIAMTKAPKIIAGLAGGGLALGLGLAFLLELVVDRSFKRPQEVAGRLKLPFFLSIPYLNGKMKLQLSEGGGRGKLLTASTDGAPPAEQTEPGALATTENGVVASWDEKHALRPFHETLRDRLVAYFEMLNLTHKPKLVAVTSCDIGAGVSTIASGLASSLSETGEGNVLLVNMTSEDGEAHHFYKGRLALGIDDVLEKDNRDGAMVQDNLYVVKEMSNRDRLPSILPKRFSHLVTKLKSSDYDYIIFDMPPITQISVTPRLARFMDTVLLVVEAEKTDRDVAQRATALLGESRVGVVMNKTRSYVPKRLLQEL